MGLGGESEITPGAAAACLFDDVDPGVAQRGEAALDIGQVGASLVERTRLT